MALNFSLEVFLNGYTEETGINEAADTSQRTLVATVTSATILLDSSGNSPSQQFLALFVPHDLVEESLSAVALSIASSAQAKRKCFWLEEDKRIRLSRDLMTKVHPLLTNQNIMIRAVFSVHSKHAPSDVVLLDLHPSIIPAEILEATNGDSMSDRPNAVLKLLAVSQVHISSSHAADLYMQSSVQQPLNIPSCPVCLHRIYSPRLGLAKPLNHHLCSKFCPSTSLSGATPSNRCAKQQLLQPWPHPSHCISCHVIQDYQSSEGTVFCNECALESTLWVCLTCGFCGCGRYSNKHAEAHFLESGHSYSLELATLRIWDYTNGEFAHRGDLLECPSVRHLLRAQVPSSHRGGGAWEIAQQPYLHDEKSPKKAIMIGEEYEALLQSALEDQAQHYEGEISRLRAALTAEQVDPNSMTREEVQAVQSLRSEIATLRKDLDCIGRDLINSQAQEAGHRADSQRLLRQQQVAQDLLKTIQEAATREKEQGIMQVEELEQQIADLNANLRMRHQFSQDQELTNAQICGTMSTPESKQGRKGKNRRMLRK